MEYFGASPGQPDNRQHAENVSMIVGLDLRVILESVSFSTRSYPCGQVQSSCREDSLRNLFSPLCFDSPRIEEIEFDPMCRDDITQVLTELQLLWMNEQVRINLLEELRERYSRKVDVYNGRPGMSFWQVLVLGVLRHRLDWDYDRLCNLALKHEDIRAMLQLSPLSRILLRSSKIAWNVKLLLDEEGLQLVNGAIDGLGKKGPDRRK